MFSTSQNKFAFAFLSILDHFQALIVAVQVLPQKNVYVFPYCTNKPFISKPCDRDSHLFYSVYTINQ